MTTFKWVLVLLGLYPYCFLYGLDTTIAADIQGAVISDFDNVSQLAWLGSGFPLGSVSVILMLGTLYTSFNYKWTYLAGVLLFEVGSAICGAAPNMNALIIGRVIAGFGGSSIYMGSLNFVSSLTGPEERGGYIAGIGFFWGLGAVLGPVIGGGFAESGATWRWAFYINLPVGALVAPIALFYLPSIHPRTGVSVGRRIKELDFVGYVLNIGTWVSFSLAFTMAGAQWAWADGRTIATIVVFAVLLVLYSLQQYFAVFTSPERRCFPVHLLASRTKILLNVAQSANMSALFVTIYFIPIYFQFVHNDTAIMAAVRLLPFVAISVTLNLASGILISRVRRYQLIYLISGVFIVVGGSALMALLKRDTSQANIYGFTVLMALGVGITMQLSYAVGSLLSAEKDQGHIMSFLNVAQIGSAVISLVVAGQVFQSLAAQKLRAALDGQGFSDEQIRGGVAGVRSELFSQLSGELRERAVDAVTAAMQRAFVLPVVAGAVILVSGLLMKREKFYKEATTSQ